MAPKALLLLLAASTGCSRENEMRSLAAHDFGCPANEIQILEERADISEPTWEITACGHHARYTCHVPDRHSHDPERRAGICEKDLEYEK